VERGRAAEVSREAVEAYLHEHIPISRAMGIGVVEAGAERVALKAPLEPNVNHRSTVFGGSCASVAILAAWTLVHLRVQASGIVARVVIQRGTTEYRLPIRRTFVATCDSPGEPTWDKFVRVLRRRGQARIELDVVVTSDGEVVATFSGAYVALAGRPEAGTAGDVEPGDSGG
jgi:thioesterase domain-containing protein